MYHDAANTITLPIGLAMRIMQDKGSPYWGPSALLDYSERRVGDRKRSLITSDHLVGVVEKR